ncbi:MAG: UDP-N-acetylmuramate--L-alanine ligase [Alphaproteobacteria bacterium]
MRALPLDIGTIHFSGIGGIGMSGIAETLHALGYKVQGSDLAENANVRRLRDKGIPIFIGHSDTNVSAAHVVVVSSAIKDDNPEIAGARARLVPVVRRAEMLGELMRLKWSVAVAGTHGKTTTTSLIAAVLDGAGLDPTVINGGIINAYGTNARLGSGDWMVVEADESDGSFVRLPATVVVVTNIDPEHMDFYGDFDALRRAFASFVANIPFYGVAAMCADHPEVQALTARLTDRRVITYGFSRQADVRGANLRVNAEGSRFDIEFGEHGSGDPRTLEGMYLPMLGAHNVQNALAAVAIAGELGIADDVLRSAFAEFAGVKRRFTKTGEVVGVTVIDDYGHHPVEITAVLDAARTACKGRIVAVFQPHRYTRLSSLFEEFCTCFKDADTVLVADVYEAGEAPIEGASRDALVAGLTAHGHRDARALGSPDELAAVIGDTVAPGDMVVCLGAGSITSWAQALPGQLQAFAGPIRGRES